MAQLNHNVSYLTVVDGLTVWERLRVIRNFLIERNQALALSELEIDKNKSETDEFKLREIVIMLPQSLALIEDAKREIKFLKEFEAKLQEEAYKSRIDGKSDEEMYEINYFEELIQKQLLIVSSEILTTNTVSPATMEMLLRNKETAKRAVGLGFIKKELLNINSDSDLVTLINKEVKLLTP